MDQSNLLKELIEFNDGPRPRTPEGKDKEIFTKVHVLFMKIEN